MFNKYKWLEEQKESLKEYIVTEWANGNTPDYGDLCEQLQSDIDNDCIYYSNCWEICKQIAPSFDWDKLDFAPINSISQLAYASLYEFANENLDIEQLLEETLNEI